MQKQIIHSKEYSAGAVKFSFWFSEFRKIVTMVRSGQTLESIKISAANENIFSAVTLRRSTQIFNTVANRVASLPDEFLELFEPASLATQKLITLISIMNTDRLFFDNLHILH